VLCLSLLVSQRLALITCSWRGSTLLCPCIRNA